MTMSAMRAVAEAIRIVEKNLRRQPESVIAALMAEHNWDLLLPHHLVTMHGQPTPYLFSFRGTALWLDRTGPIAFPYPPSVARWPLYDGGREPYWAPELAEQYVGRLRKLLAAMRAHDKALASLDAKEGRNAGR